ncbi:MAG: type II secretion system F family protein [Planctomycetaceae bacterium]
MSHDETADAPESRDLTDEPSPDVETPPGYADSATREQSTSWADRRLFAGIVRRTDDGDAALRRVEPRDVPTVDTGDYVFGGLTPVLAALFPDSDRRRKQTKQELRSAGYLSPHAAQNLAAIRYVLMMLPLVSGGLLLISAPRSFEPAILASMVVLTAVGWAYPRVFVRNKARRRVFRIEQALPDMLDMLNMCVSQGMTVSEALRRIGDELEVTGPDLSRELRIVCEQSDIGTLEHALDNFADRVDSEEVRSFTSLLIQTERMGTSISQALIDYSDNFRDSHRQEADRRANAAAFKLLFPTVLCLMPAVYLFLLGPAVIELSNFMGGEGRQILERGRNAVQDLNRDRPPIQPR